MSSPAARPEGAIPVLSLHQPHASLVAMLEKPVETRSWSTTYRGLLAIASTARIPADYSPPVREGEGWSERIGDWRILHEKRVLRGRTLSERHSLVRVGSRERLPMPTGCILAVVNLVDVFPTEDIQWGHGTPASGWAIVNARPWVLEAQRPYGDYSPNRYAWLLGAIRPLATPVPFKGGRTLTKWWVPTEEAA